MAILDTEKLNQKFDEEFKKLSTNVSKPGILLAGQTGVGKSSLVNMIFGEDVAEVGIGKPVSKKIDLYETNNLRLFDSRGYETIKDGDNDFATEVIGMVQADDTQTKVNIIWYCISCSNHRVTDFDKDNIKKFIDAHCPLAVVFTQVDSTTEEQFVKLKNEIRTISADIPFFQTSIYEAELSQSEALIDWSIAKLPQHLQFAFISQQKVSFTKKRVSATLAIAEHVVAAGIVGAAPLPIADAAILAGNEMALMARILYIYDMGGLGNNLKIGAILTALGKFAATSLLNFIPIAGNIIKAGVAVSITWAFGGALALACEKIWKAKLNGEETTSLINNFGSIVEQIAKEKMESGHTTKETIFKD